MTIRPNTERLGSLFSFKNGRAFNKSEWSESGIPIIRIQNLNSKDARFNHFSGSYTKDIEVNDGDLLFSWSGTVGSSFGAHLWSGGVGVLNQHIFKVGFKKDVCPRYAYYALTEITTEIEKSVNGAVGLVHITKSDLNEFRIPFPERAEQERIVGILDEAFEGIATATAHAERNLRNARELFQSVLQSTFDQKGEGWVECGKTLSELCDLVIDCEHKTAPTQETGIPSIRTPNIGRGDLLLDGVYRVSDETYEKWTRRGKPMPGDLILAREAPAGNIAVIPEGMRVCLGQRTVLIRPSKDSFIPRFLAFHILEPVTQARLLAHSTGSTVQHVNLRDIRALRFSLLPRLSMQRAIVAKLDALATETRQLEAIYERKLAALAELKQALLRKAFAGEL